MAKKASKVKDGLPRKAFAIAGEPDNPDTWHLPHHKRSICRALKGGFDLESTVDWDKTATAVSALSPLYQNKRVQASPEEILEAANHRAGHYLKANKALPDILAALV